jgi:hypothetical protein
MIDFAGTFLAIEETVTPDSLANGFSPIKRFSSRAKPVCLIHQVVM